VSLPPGQARLRRRIVAVSVRARRGDLRNLRFTRPSRGAQLALRAVRQPEAVVDSTRQEWADAHRRLESLASDQALYARLVDELEVVTDELRRRVGEIFTLEQLVAAYVDADQWSREVLDERGAPGAYRHATLLEDAAFHLYSRAASDYRP
jgi:hypothetical protein